MRKLAFVALLCVVTLMVGCSTSPVPMATTTQTQVDTATQSALLQSTKDLTAAKVQVAADATEITALKAQIRNPLALHIENFFRFCIGCVIGIFIGILVTPVIQILDAGLATTIEKDEAGIAHYIAAAITWVITLFSGKKPAAPVAGNTTKG